jgi:hypothetical protein
VQYFPATPYPDNEKPKLALLENLFREWYQYFSSNSTVLKKHVADDMVADGFYPHYFDQKKRILFVGREARGISGCNYIDVLYPAYRETKRIGKQWLNTNKFHSRMLYVAYGIMNGMPAWNEIPYASEIGDTFGTPGGLSFAFMNISKLSNDSNGWQSAWRIINVAHELSTRSRNFNQEQTAILEPHIVITMNLGDRIASLGQLTPIHSSTQARSFWLVSGGHRSLLIDTWHFSTPYKNSIKDYYEPICHALRLSET